MNDEMNIYIVGSSTYYEKTLPLLNDILRHSKKICYVLLNQPYSRIKELFLENSIDPKRFIFVDGVTKRIQLPPKIDGVIFLDAPFQLENLLSITSKIISEGQISHIVFDNLAQPAIGSNLDDLAKFMLHLERKAKAHNVSAAFLFPYEEVGARLLGKIESLSSDNTS